MKICVDCEWKSGDYCDCPKNITSSIDNVSGASVKHYHISFCFAHRNEEGWLASRFLGLCGKEGRWFEPKIKENK